MPFTISWFLDLKPPRKKGTPTSVRCLNVEALNVVQRVKFWVGRVKSCLNTAVLRESVNPPFLTHFIRRFFAAPTPLHSTPLPSFTNHPQVAIMAAIRPRADNQLQNARIQFDHNVTASPFNKQGQFAGVRNTFLNAQMLQPGQHLKPAPQKYIQQDIAILGDQYAQQFPANTVYINLPADGGALNAIGAQAGTDVGKLAVQVGDRSRVIAGSVGFFRALEKATGAQKQLLQTALALSYPTVPALAQYASTGRQAMGAQAYSDIAAQAFPRDTSRIASGQMGFTTEFVRNPSRYLAGLTIDDVNTAIGPNAGLNAAYNYARGQTGLGPNRGSKRNAQGTFGLGTMNPIYNNATKQPIYGLQSGWTNGGRRTSGYKLSGANCFADLTTDPTYGLNAGVRSVASRRDSRRRGNCGGKTSWTDIPETVALANNVGGQQIFARKFGSQNIANNEADVNDFYAAARGNVAPVGFADDPSSAPLYQAYKDLNSARRQRVSSRGLAANSAQRQNKPAAGEWPVGAR